MNGKIDEIVKSVKEFGIAAEDIKTQNLSVNQGEETYYEEGRQKQRPGQWRVSNSIEIKLRDVNRASGLANLLTKSGATNVYGPNFSLEDIGSVEEDLLKEAIENAHTKAQVMANSSGYTLGDIISVTEGGQSLQTLTSATFGGIGSGGGGASLQPGTGTAGKTVTIVFELE